MNALQQEMGAKNKAEFFRSLSYCPLPKMSDHNSLQPNNFAALKKTMFHVEQNLCDLRNLSASCSGSLERSARNLLPLGRDLSRQLETTEKSAG